MLRFEAQEVPETKAGRLRQAGDKSTGWSPKACGSREAEEIRTG